MPKHKKYDWSDKRDICYRLWVEEERTMPEMKQYFSQALGVAEDSIPSYVLSLSSTVLRTPLSHVNTSPLSRVAFTDTVQNPDFQSPIQRMGLPTTLEDNNTRSPGETSRTHQAALGAGPPPWRNGIGYAR